MRELVTVARLFGLLLLAFGASMAVPAGLDAWDGDANWRAFAAAGGLSGFVGGGLALACAGRGGGAITIRQALLLTMAGWVALPGFGAVPFMLGAPGVGWTDAYFEAMSGLTTTGATVFSGLESLPRGVLFWRLLLHWYGGIGIIVAALALFPALGLGGMQLFRSESFDTQGKVLPRASEIAISVGWIYVALTLACAIAFAASGMGGFDALGHAMSTIATGGFANYDASLGHFGATIEYVATPFMLLASLPFARFIQLMGRQRGALLVDSQVRAFLGVYLCVVGAIAAQRLWAGEPELEPVLRETLFNAASILTGTGFASEDYQLWGPGPVLVLFIAGLVGGCSGSATCAIKVFRFQILVSAVLARVRALHSPSGVFTPRYQGRRIDDEVLSSVMAFLYFFALALVIVTAALAMIGLDAVTAISGAAAMLANIGPGFGPIIGPSGHFAPLPDAAKWVMCAAMLLGRLEVLSVLVLFTAAFWRD